jgi:hypothetical protein
MNSVVVCETPRLFSGLGRDIEYTYPHLYDFWSSGVAYMKA